MPVATIETLVRHVRDALARGDAARAEALCRECLALDPAREDALAFLAMRAIGRGEPASVRALLERAAALRPDAALLHFHHGCVLEAIGALAEARDAFERATVADPAMLLAQFWLAEQHAALDDPARALSTAVRAVAAAERSGYGRTLAELPADARARIDACVARTRAGRGAVIDEALGATASPRVRAAFSRYLGHDSPASSHPGQRPSFLLIPDLPARAWFERHEFPFLAAIEAETDAIRAELLDVIADTTRLTPYVDMPPDAPAAPMWSALNRSRRWSAYHLFRHGEAIAAHTARCPATVAALEALPLMRIAAHSPEALYSILEPRTRIPPHTGVMNGRLTVHLPLVVPANCGALRVADESRAWEAGRCLVFDDSLVHEAWNDADATRAVLIFDIWDPRLAAEERAAIAAAVAAIGRFHARHGAYDATHEA